MMSKRDRLFHLIREKALKRGEFILSSGKRSSYYLDLRAITLDPEGSFLAASLILEKLSKENLKVDAIGGPTLGADPIVGAVLALSYNQRKPLRGFIVRKERKKYGTKNLIEGSLNAGDKVLVIDDVATTGASLLKAIKEVENFGYKILETWVIVDREEGAKDKLKAEGYSLFSFYTMSEFLNDLNINIQNSKNIY